MNIHVATSCEPQYPPKVSGVRVVFSSQSVTSVLLQGTHISCLPNDVIRHVVLWLVSDELDLKSLEQLSMVCMALLLMSCDCPSDVM